MSEASFGQRVRETRAAGDLLALEVAERRDEAFAAVDVVVAGIMIRAMRGERVVTLEKTKRGDTLAIVGIPDTLKAALPNAFQLEAQQARGAWFIPEAVAIKARSLLLPSLFRQAPRYSHTLARDERGKIALAGNADAMVVWAVLEPFADTLLAPIFLRIEESGLLSREAFADQWTTMTERLVDLGLALVEELRPFAWGGWAPLSAEEQLESKARLLSALAAQLSADVVRRYRASMTLRLVAQYYAKAKNGRAKRRQVVTREHARTLAGFFAGDWLAFVRYLGEEPHDEERVVTALPTPKIIVSGKSKAAEMAAKSGLPVEEVERILGAFWQDASANSPVLDRVGALTEYWRHVDAIHARQVPNMLPLWGLVEEGGRATLEPQPHTPHQGALYRRLLPAEVVARIDRMWGTTVLTKWPDCVVSEPFPHTIMAETFGPALKFWHGCGLTAWFVCEGPSSRTDIAGLAEYYERELRALHDGGCPVHQQLFEELKAVRLGPEGPVTTSDNEVDLYGPYERSRRKGFELLRDVITRHRQLWAGQYLDKYIRGRWEVELKATAHQFHLLTEEKGKPPTLKQFAKYAVEPAQHWFGGDVGLLYGSLGQKVAGDGVRCNLRMPADRFEFAGAVFVQLGGTPFEWSPSGIREEQQRQAAERDRHQKLRRLAAESLAYVQLTEALGHAPSLKQFGSKFEWLGEVLSEDVETAWTIFARAVSDLLEVYEPSAG